jgi:D-alanyl-D-alanine carboxypeptidase
MSSRVPAALLAVLCFFLAGPRADAAPTLLFDAATGKVLYAEEADRLWYPASLTKIMTAYVVFEALKKGEITFEAELVSSETAAKEPPSKIGLPIGAKIPLELGLKSLIIKSANDVAVMLAEAVAGNTEIFVGRMNETANRLGLTRTHFVNPNGLPVPGQTTTARDLARLTQALMRDFPEHAHYWATPYMRIGKRRLRSHNSLLRTFAGADGVKTGFICDSGFNIVASATRNGVRLVAIVLGAISARDRGIRAAALLEHGFETRAWKLFFAPQSIETLTVSTQSDEIVSIRDKVTGWSCGNRLTARAKARARRREQLRRRKARTRKLRHAAQSGPTPTLPQALRPGQIPAPALR